jgi:hypothetical protein
MTRIFKAIEEWRSRRADLRQEWVFHIQRAAFELEDLGFSREEARQLAEERLGPRSRYRRKAIRDAGAGLAGLVALIAPRPPWRSPWAVPAALFAALALVVALNPGRKAVASAVLDPANFLRDGVTPYPPPPNCWPALPSATPRTAADPCVLRAPWMKPIVIPAGWAKLFFGAFFLGTVWPLARMVLRTRKGWRLLLFGVAFQGGIVLLATTVWVTTLQYFMLITWTDWALREVSIVSLHLGLIGVAAGTAKWWRTDVYRRCPECLERLLLPEEHGRMNSFLLEPLEVEMVCVNGHGTLAEDHWQRRFLMARGFWHDLAGSDRAPASR